MRKKAFFLRVSSGEYKVSMKKMLLLSQKKDDDKNIYNGPPAKIDIVHKILLCSVPVFENSSNLWGD